MKMPKVSVVIPAYNAAALIKRALESVFAQEEDLEVIVVDDCSTDDTIAVVENLHDRRVKVLRQSENKGPAAARNKGLEEASGKYIAFLDADDYWKSGFLKKTSHFLDSHPEAISVFTGQEHKTFSAESSIEPKCLIRGTASANAVVLEDFFAFWKEQGVTPLCSGSVLMRGDLIRPLGGQREDLRICEDLEYWCLIAVHGKMGFIPEVLFVSDGARNGEARQKLTRRQRLQRYIPRWKNARSMAEWGRRIFVTQSPVLVTDAFQYVMGDVAGIMIYSMIQDGRWRNAYQEFRKYRKWLPKNPVNKLLACFGACSFTWYCVCFLLYLRERLKK